MGSRCTLLINKEVAKIKGIHRYLPSSTGSLASSLSKLQDVLIGVQIYLDLFMLNLLNSSFQYLALLVNVSPVINGFVGLEIIKSPPLLISQIHFASS